MIFVVSTQALDEFKDLQKKLDRQSQLQTDAERFATKVSPHIMMDFPEKLKHQITLKNCKPLSYMTGSEYHRK